MSPEELSDIRKYSDLITEIDTIEFHLNLTKKHNEIVKGLVCDFFYTTSYDLDYYDIIELKQRLNVDVEKAGSGVCYLFYSIETIHLKNWA